MRKAINPYASPRETCVTLHGAAGHTEAWGSGAALLMSECPLAVGQTPGRVPFTQLGYRKNDHSYAFS